MAVQVAFVMVLLVAAGLMLNSLWRMLSAPLGFDAERLVTLELLLPRDWLTPGNQSRAAFETELLGRIRATPGVSRASASTTVPFSVGVAVAVGVEGTPTPRWALLTAAEADYLPLLGVSLRTGRPLSPSDDAQGLLVAVVNDAFVRQYLSGPEPLGRRVRLIDDHYIVGVVSDITEFTDGTIRHNPGLIASRPPAIYVPATQAPWGRQMFVTVRTTVPPLTAVPAFRKMIAALNRGVIIKDASTMNNRIGQRMAATRFYAVVLAAVAAVGLLLAVVGTYGAVSQTVREQTRDIGIRIALGATPARVIAMVVGHLALPLFGGIALGLAFAWPAARLAKSLLFGLTPTDPTTWLMTAVLLGASGTTAALIPAYRASHLNPIDVVRAE